MEDHNNGQVQADELTSVADDMPIGPDPDGPLSPAQLASIQAAAERSAHDEVIQEFGSDLITEPGLTQEQITMLLGESIIGRSALTTQIRQRDELISRLSAEIVRLRGVETPSG